MTLSLQLTSSQKIQIMLLQKKKFCQYLMSPLGRWDVLLEEEGRRSCPSKSLASTSLSKFINIFFCTYRCKDLFCFSYYLNNFLLNQNVLHLCSAEIFIGGAKGPPDKVSLSLNTFKQTTETFFFVYKAQSQRSVKSGPAFNYSSITNTWYI